MPNGFTQNLTEEEVNHPRYNEYQEYWGDVAGDDCIPLTFAEWLKDHEEPK